MRRVAFALCCFLATGFTFMWIAGLFTCTKVGLDHNERFADRPGEELTTYYRFSWPGNGSFYLQKIALWHPAGKREGSWDPGGMFFHARLRPARKSFWNKCGFWYAGDVTDDELTTMRFPEAVESWHAGVPAWLPAMVFGIWPLGRLWAARKKKESGRAPVTSSPSS